MTYWEIGHEGRFYVGIQSEIEERYIFRASTYLPTLVAGIAKSTPSELGLTEGEYLKLCHEMWIYVDATKASKTERETQ